MKLYLFITAIVLLSSCKVEKIERNAVEELLAKGIDASGGLENWRNLDTIRFYKTTKLYLEDGSIEDSTYQLHSYIMHPKMDGQYEWDDIDGHHKVKYSDGIMTKFRNGQELILSLEESEKLRLGFLGAQFVMCLPFKLNDPGVELNMGDIDQIGGIDAKVIMASYDGDKENHTKTHDWWHYFDTENYQYLGYKVYHAPTYAKVQNVKTRVIDGITFPTYRKTYRVDKDDKELFVRAEFWYDFINTN